MHPHTRVTATEITKTILVLLGGGAVITVGLGLNPYHTHKLPLALALFSARRIRQTMRRLRLQGHVRYDPRDNTAPITLTKKGMERAARYTLRDFFRGKRRWDYLWRLVMFDIPERLRGKRLALQRTLLLAGFYPLQKSVFVSPYPCEKELAKSLDLLRIRRFMLFAATASLGKEEDRVRKFFFRRGNR